MLLSKILSLFGIHIIDRASSNLIGSHVERKGCNLSMPKTMPYVDYGQALRRKYNEVYAAKRRIVMTRIHVHLADHITLEHTKPTNSRANHKPERITPRIVLDTHGPQLSFRRDCQPGCDEQVLAGLT